MESKQNKKIKNDIKTFSNKLPYFSKCLPKLCLLY